MSMKINKLEIENVKRVKAVKLEPTTNGLTIIGGDNGQGKTSVLDAIAWALGGNKYKPSQAQREGSVIPPVLKIVMSNGLVVERKGKNSDLKVTDPSGQKAGQMLLDSFVEELAINLPKFMDANNKEKADILLQIIGVGDQLIALEQAEKEIYNRRHAIGQIADQKAKYAKEQEYYPDAPADLISPADLIRQQQEIMARNGENQRKREALNQITINKIKVFDEAKLLEDQITALQERYEAKRTEHEQLVNDEAIALKSVSELQDESTAELEKNLLEVEEINRKVRANFDKEKAEDDAREYQKQYEALTEEIAEVRKQKAELLDNADLPLDGLSVEEGNLIYNGQQWDNMSSSEQLKVSTAIVRKLKPECGFVLLDKLEMMDKKTLDEFGKWLEAEGLQAIATRVSTGEECQIIIEDGYVKDAETRPTEEAIEESETEQPKWNF